MKINQLYLLQYSNNAQQLLHLSFKKSGNMKQKSTLLITAICLLLQVIGKAQNFSKVTTGPVVTSPGDSRSVNWVDLNNDDLPDLMITNGPAGGQNNFLYLNDGQGGFIAVTNDTIVNDSKPSDGATWADTDNDGDLDCFVANWYNSIGLYYTGNGNGTFTYQPGVGLTNGITYSETAAWGDYDRDGYVDLYVARSGGTVATNRNFLFHNNAGNSFTKITSGTPTTDAAISRSVNWTDIDGDGDLDLFVTNEGSSNNNEHMYRNDSAGQFVKLTAGPLLNDGKSTMSSSWGDFDNDGDLDVFLANDNSTNGLFRNDGNFVFNKLSSDTVSTTPSNSFSSAWADVDNDGDLDLFVTNAFAASAKLTCFFYLNNGNSTFSRVANHTLVQDSGWTYGCAFADYDKDGFQDLAVATCRYQGVDAVDYLYHNQGNTNNWISIKLIGSQSNRSAIGSKIRVKANINGSPVWQLREISAQSSYCGQNELRGHFGLGTASIIDSLKIEWPSGLITYFDSVSINQFITITEGQGLAIESTAKLYNELQCYPNPVNEKITIRTRDLNLQPGDELVFQNSSGDTLSRINIQTSVKEITVDLKQQGMQTKGIYYVTHISNSKKITKKILKL